MDDEKRKPVKRLTRSWTASLPPAFPTPPAPPPRASSTARAPVVEGEREKEKQGMDVEPEEERFVVRTILLAFDACRMYSHLAFGDWTTVLTTHVFQCGGGIALSC